MSATGEVRAPSTSDGVPQEPCSASSRAAGRWRTGAAAAALIAASAAARRTPRSTTRSLGDGRASSGAGAVRAGAAAQAVLRARGAPACGSGGDHAMARREGVDWFAGRVHSVERRTAASGSWGSSGSGPRTSPEDLGRSSPCRLGRPGRSWRSGPRRCPEDLGAGQLGRRGADGLGVQPAGGAGQPLERSRDADGREHPAVACCAPARTPTPRPSRARRPSAPSPGGAPRRACGG